MESLSPSAWITIAVLTGMVILFATEKIRPEIVAVTGLVLMALTGVIEPVTALAGFAHPAVVTVVAFFILSAAITDADVPQAIARFLSRVAGGSRSGLLAMTMASVGAMSAFINNIAATLILLPAITGMARTARISSLKLLMPLSFGSLLGGLATLIGTPPNIIAADLLNESGQGRLTMFDFAPTGLAVAVTGIIYFVLIGHRLLPSRPAQGDVGLVEQVRTFLFELQISGSFADPGARLHELGWRAKYDLSVLEIRRSGLRQRTVTSNDQIFINDTVVVAGEYDDVMALAKLPGVEHARSWRGSIAADANTIVAEIVATPWFETVDTSLANYGFGQRFGGLVLGIWRHGERLHTNLARLHIRSGDVLLVQFPRHGLNALAQDSHFLLLGQRTDHQENASPSAPRALLVLVAVIAVAALGLTHIAIAVVAGILAMLALRVISRRRLYEAVDWQLPILIGAMIPIGGAMQSTGVATVVAEQLAAAIAGYGPQALVAGLFITTALLTQATANATAVVIMAPIALSLAGQDVGISATGLMITVAIAASTAFLTPFGHQANLLVYNVAGYRYLEFARAGAPLTLLVLGVTVITVQLVWPG